MDEEAFKTLDELKSWCEMCGKFDCMDEYERLDCKIDDILNENSINAFQEELQYLPEVVSYIDDMKRCILQQQHRIKLLLRKIEKYEENISACQSKCDTSTQTDDVDEEVTDNSPWQSKDEKTSVADEVTRAAQNAMQQTGFVYEETSGMYYDYNTGYYYNAEYGLYYDGDSGTYYFYDEESKTFQFHSQIEKSESTEGHKEICDKPLKTLSKDEGKKKPKAGEVGYESPEEGECSETSDEEDLSMAEHESGASHWPPCMRIIVQESISQRIKVGSLFIVTCKGGTLGREGDHSVLLPDINISKQHAKFTFSETENKFFVTDFGSCNGTYLNGTRLSSQKQESELHEVVHGSIMEVASTKLLCHIHKGRETCGLCEPGLIQPAPKSSDKPENLTHSRRSRKTEYKKEMDRLKRKFGLEGGFGGDSSRPSSTYEDRAQIRRETVGSQNPYEKTEVASLDEPIPCDNKGFKLMSKMGWSPGQPLGKEVTSTTEPVSLTVREGKAGLGAMPSALPMSPKSSRRAEILKKTQKRYHQR